jgi:glycosyltransferase involved in cell wall biosynthesis
MTPRVSVVMPVYNGERLLGEAVESILRQSFDNWELIAVDDGSRDRSLEILRAYAIKDRRVRVHPMAANGGAIAARNTGTELARGEFIAVMDADDVSLPQRLATQLQYLDDHRETGVVGSFVQLIDGDGKRSDVRTFPTDPALMAWSMLFFNCLAHPSVMMRRNVLESANGYAPECKGGAEDYDLFAKVSRIARLATIPEVLVLYRKWEGNMTKRAWESQERDANRIVGEAAAFLLGSGISEDLAKDLRGLATSNYPRKGDGIRKLGGLIEQLFEAFVQQTWLTAPDKKLVARDAGIKLWLLASLATRRSPAVAASLSASAFAMSPASLPGFVAKAARRLASKR